MNRNHAIITGCFLLAVVVTASISRLRPSADATQSSNTIPSHQPTTPAEEPARPRFTDVTEKSGIRFRHHNGAAGQFLLPELIGSGAAFLDFNNDNRIDLYMIQSGNSLLQTANPENPGPNSTNRLYRNDGGGTFTDVTEESHTGIGGYGIGCAAADYNNDGNVDLYITRIGPNVLLKNNGDGTFSDVSEAAGAAVDGFSTAAAFLDFDRDGILDLFVVNYVNWSASREPTCFDARGTRDYCGPSDYRAPSSDYLLRGSGSGVFEDVSRTSGVASAKGNGLGIICSDLNQDGWTDIYVANDQNPAILWINQKNGTFQNEAMIRGAALSGEGIAIAGMGTAASDLDNDGDPDLIITNIRDQPHLSLRNDGEFFEDVSHAWGFAGWAVPYTGFGIAIFDADHDGILEGFIANGAVNHLAEPFLQNHDYAMPNQYIRRDDNGRFYDATTTAGRALKSIAVSRSVLTADYDNDGDLDLLVTNNNAKPQLLSNQSPHQGAWTQIDLRPTSGSRVAIGAKVAITTTAATYHRDVRPHTGYLSSNDPRLHIGLGQSETIDRLTVTWQDRTTETWTKLPVNQRLILHQNQAPQYTMPTREKITQP